MRWTFEYSRMWRARHINGQCLTLGAADFSETPRRLLAQRARLAVMAYCSTSSATYRDHRSAVSAETDGHVGLSFRGGGVIK
jgi:hypothetical protein